MKGGKMEIQTIKQEMERALSFEDNVARIQALDEVISLTGSSNLPPFLKKRIISRCAENQVNTVASLDFQGFDESD